MKYDYRAIALMGVMTVVVGCGMRQSTTGHPEMGYLAFGNSLLSAQIQIDDGQLQPLGDLDENTRYSIRSGGHRVRILLDGEVIVDQLAFIAAGQTCLIEIPK